MAAGDRLFAAEPAQPIIYLGTGKHMSRRVSVKRFAGTRFHSLLPGRRRYPAPPAMDDKQPNVDDSRLLICAECGCESDPLAAGWRGYYDAEDELVLFCRECAEREFGTKTT